MNRKHAITLIIASTFINSFAQVLFKLGSSSLKLDIYAIITNYPVISGFALYAISAMFMIIAFKYGELSVLYPIFATAYIWVTLSSAYVFGEVLNTYKMIGIAFVFLGVTCIGYGSKEADA